MKATYHDAGHTQLFLSLEMYGLHYLRIQRKEKLYLNRASREVFQAEVSSYRSQHR